MKGNTFHFLSSCLSRIASLFLLFVSLAAIAQTASITGIVTDAVTREPLPGATVFIAESTNGTFTDQEGRYTLTGVETGAVRVFASFVGFGSQRHVLIVREGENVYDASFVLIPSEISLEAIVVQGKRDRAWRRNLERFTNQFVGETSNARKTQIVNPEALTFAGSTRDRLVAQISDPLVIENRALGYRITYHLTTFETTSLRTTYAGEPLYHMLKPASGRESERWRKA